MASPWWTLLPWRRVPLYVYIASYSTRMSPIQTLTFVIFYSVEKSMCHICEGLLMLGQWLCFGSFLSILGFFVFFLTTFCVSRRRRQMYCGHARLCVCVCVCVCLRLSVRGRTPTLLHGPGCNLAAW